MKRDAFTMPVEQLADQFLAIEFPEYQREPDVWTLEQKQRLIDSILREFDISTIYFYQRGDGTRECIDGRQRINAILSFLGRNEFDTAHNGFRLKTYNEIYPEEEAPYSSFAGLSFKEIEAEDQRRAGDTRGILARSLIEAITRYNITVVNLSGIHEPAEFNLQFLRLNLGTLINSGEKLHAMVGNLRDLIFQSEAVGKHPFFQHLQIPTRRFATEQVAAQSLIQFFSLAADPPEFARARHTDLQRFLKEHATIDDSDPRLTAFTETLDALQDGLSDTADKLKSRAIVVSVVVMAWTRHLHEKPEDMEKFGEFLEVFLDLLAEQVQNMRNFTRDDRFRYLVDFQRQVTQASVEKYAVARRDEILQTQFEHWLSHGRLEGQ